MKKLSITISFLLLWTFGFAQQYNKDFDFMWLKPQKPNIKTVKKTENGKLLLFQEYDTNGKCYFIKNDGMNGEVTAIWGIDYDKEGREIKTIFAHSNVGFYIYETVYSENIIKLYTYTIDTIEIVYDDKEFTETVAEPFEYNAFSDIISINSKSDLESFKRVKDVYKQKRFLQNITILNEQNKPSIEYFLNHKGDTTDYIKNIYSDELITNEYYYLKDRMTDDFKDYSFLDENSNSVKSFRVFYSEKKTDTTDFKVNSYLHNKKVSTTTFENGKEDRKLIYQYGNNGLIKEEFSESDYPNKSRHFTFEYNKKGELIEEKVFDEDGTEIIPINTYKTTYEYWKKNYR